MVGWYAGVTCKKEKVEGFRTLMDKVFGDGICLCGISGV